MTNIVTKRNQRITARLRRIQGQVAAMERSLAEDPDGATLLQRVAATTFILVARRGSSMPTRY